MQTSIFTCTFANKKREGVHCTVYTVRYAPDAPSYGLWIRSQMLLQHKICIPAATKKKIIRCRFLFCRFVCMPAVTRNRSVKFRSNDVDLHRFFSCRCYCCRYTAMHHKEKCFANVCMRDAANAKLHIFIVSNVIIIKSVSNKVGWLPFAIYLVAVRACAMLACLLMIVCIPRRINCRCHFDDWIRNLHSAAFTLLYNA